MFSVNSWLGNLILPSKLKLELMLIKFIDFIKLNPFKCDKNNACFYIY